MKKKDFLLSVFAFTMAAMLSVGFSSCGGDGDGDGGGGSSNDALSVSPYDLQLDGTMNSLGTFVITSTTDWNIYGGSNWFKVSSTGGSKGSTTITVTTTESNNSDGERAEKLTISAGSERKEVTIRQSPRYANNSRIRVANELIVSDGYYADLEFDPDVLGYVEGYYNERVLNTKTEDEIYEEVKAGTSYSHSDYDFTFMSGLSASTNYIYCVIGYTGTGSSRKWGPMTIQHFSTKSSSNYCDASVGTITYNTTTWTIPVTKQQRCHHYYRMYATNAEALDCYNVYPYVVLAKMIRDRIEDKVNYPNYDYFLNDGAHSLTRVSSEYAIFFWTWGVDDTGAFSGNIRFGYRNLNASSAPKAATANPSLTVEKTFKRSDIENMEKNLSIYKY